MQASIFTQIVLPLVLASIMFGMGLSLQRSDFSRLIKLPRPVFVGLFGQLIVLPLLAFVLAIVLKAPPPIAIGLMVLSACPGGTTSNLFAHLARANLALSISLTAITTIICVFTTPLLIAFSLRYFAGELAIEFSLLKTSLGLMIISLLPVVLGMWLRRKSSRIALALEPWFRRFAIVFMILLIAKISYDEWDMLMSAFPYVFVLAITLNLLATMAGMALGKMCLLRLKDNVTLGIEIGTQNATLAMMIAISFIQQPSFAAVAGVYGITMYLGATILLLYTRRQANLRD